jgi:hypothetical protein
MYSIAMDYEAKFKELEAENLKLKEQLNKYLLKNKTYYENNKEKHKQQVKEYQKHNKPTPEKKKEYARRAYLKKKEKLKQQKEIN